MLGGWLHDAAAATSESVVQLPFARGGSKAPGRRAGGQLGERQPPSPRHRHHDGEGAAFGLDPSSVVEVGGWAGCFNAVPYIHASVRLIN